MANTGYLVITYQDFNPLSSTYNTTKEEVIYDSATCPSNNAIWELVDSYCEIHEDGMFTGNRIDIYEDTNQASDTYGQQQTTIEEDLETCPPSSTEPDWQPTGEPYCEQIEYPSGVIANSGNKIQEMIDDNPLSATYQFIEEVIEEDLETCPRPSSEPEWVDISVSCNVVAVGVGVGFDGTENATQQDVNEYSATHNTTRTINRPNEIGCPPSNTDPLWIDISAVCNLDDEGINDGYETVTQEDTNPLSATYGQTRSIIRLNLTSCPTNYTMFVRPNTIEAIACGGDEYLNIDKATSNYILINPYSWISCDLMPYQGAVNAYIGDSTELTLHIAPHTNDDRERTAVLDFYCIDSDDNTVGNIYKIEITQNVCE